jgi:hypothetical protein
MSKKVRQITNCEYCDKQIILDGPVHDEYYENGRIDIADGMILLSKAIVKKYHKKGFADDHARSIDGYYCNLECFINRIKNILNGKDNR